MRSILGLATILLGAASLAPAALPAQDFSIGTFAAGSVDCDDIAPDVAVSRGGSFLLVWNRVCEGFETRLVGQLYDAEVRPIGAELDLGTGRSPALIALPDGGFAIAWTRSRSAFSSDLELVRLDARGWQLGSPRSVDAGETDPSKKLRHRLAVSGEGNFAITWIRELQQPYRQEIMLRRFNADLTPASAPIPLEDLPNAFEAPDLAFDHRGDLLVVWARSVAEFPYAFTPIFGRRYPADGSPAGPPFLITVPGFGDNLNPRLIGGSPYGGWSLTWERRLGFEVGSVFAHLPAQGVESGQISGTYVGGAPRLDSTAVNLGLDPGGNVLVLVQPLEAPLVARRFDPNGAALTEPFEVAPKPVWVFDAPAISRSSTGTLVAAWTKAERVNEESDLPDPEEMDISGRTFRPSCPVSQHAACLLGDQIGVEISRTGAGGSIEHARPIVLDATGALFAFGARAPEVAVRLRFGGEPNLDLTYAAATSVGITIRLIDRATGATATATKPPGAFASGRLGIASNAARTAATAETEPLAESPAAAAMALPIDLFGGRFRVDVNWTLPDGTKQKSRGALFDDKRATFRFDERYGGLGLVVGLVDGRTSNGKFWVSLSGLSDAAYRVKVTDTQTGKIKVYHQLAGHPTTRIDRQAF